MKQPRQFFLLALRHNNKHILQTLLLILGVALGVAMIVGVDLANQSAHQAFVLSMSTAGGRSTHQIVAGSDGIPTSLYEELRLELGLKETAPVITERIRLKNADNAYLQLLGIDPAAKLSLQNYMGNEEDEGASLGALAYLLLTPNGVAISETLSQKYKLAIGDTLTVIVNGQLKRVKLAALLQAEDELSRRALEGLMLSDISVAQTLVNKPGQIDYIDLVLPPDVDVQPILDRLPANAHLQPAGLQTRAIEEMVQSFELSLAIGSQLVLLAGAFLIYNTISFSVAQRRPILGILRCLGVTRREIFSSVLTEALAFGVIGSIVGIGLGVFLGRQLIDVVAGTVGEFYRITVQQSVGLSLLMVYKAIAAGLVASLLAAFVPAVEATTVPPQNVLQRSEQESRIQKIIPGLTIGGILLLVIGWGLLNYPTGSVAAGFGLILLFLIGFVLLTPVITQLLMRLLQPLMRRTWGIIGSMVPRDISRALSRTSVAVAALMLVVSTVIALSIIIDSFRASVTDWVQNTIRADIYILPMDLNTLAPNLIDELQQAEEIAQIAPIWESIVISPDYGPVVVRAVAPLPNEDQLPLLWSMMPGYQAGAAALEAGDVAVTEAFARHHHLPLDRPTMLTLSTDNGPRQFKVVAIFYDYQAPGPGYVLMRPHVYQAHWQNRRISLAGLYLKPELAPQTETIMQRLKAQLSDRYSLIFLSGAGVRKSIVTGFERSFTLTTALRLLSIIVGFIGIFSTLMLLQFDRIRELGILRANGMTIFQLWEKTLLETALMGLTAGLMALPVGLTLAYLLVQLVNTRFLGWVMQLRLNGAMLLLSLVIPLVAALLAGLYPAFRLSRLEIISAIREE